MGCMRSMCGVYAQYINGNVCRVQHANMHMRIKIRSIPPIHHGSAPYLPSTVDHTSHLLPWISSVPPIYDPATKSSASKHPNCLASNPTNPGTLFVGGTPKYYSVRIGVRVMVRVRVRVQGRQTLTAGQLSSCCGVHHAQ